MRGMYTGLLFKRDIRNVAYSSMVSGLGRLGAWGLRFGGSGLPGLEFAHRLGFEDVGFRVKEYAVGSGVLDW